MGMHGTYIYELLQKIGKEMNEDALWQKFLDDDREHYVNDNAISYLEDIIFAILGPVWVVLYCAMLIGW